MRRRSFLSLFGAAAVAPALPALPSPAVAAAGYNRYQYGLAVFHARTRAALTAADLMGRLKVGAGTAQAMIAEMTARGVVAPAASGALGAVRALDALPKARGPSVQDMARRVLDALDSEEDTEAEPSRDLPDPEAPETPPEARP